MLGAINFVLKAIQCLLCFMLLSELSIMLLCMLKGTFNSVDDCSGKSVKLEIYRVSLLGSPPSCVGAKSCHNVHAFCCCNVHAFGDALIE